MTLLKLPPQTLNQLKNIVYPENNLHFIGFTLNLDTGDLTDELQNIPQPEVKNSTMYDQLAGILVKYALAGKRDRMGKLVNFKDFSGGYAYENAFHKRVVEELTKHFGTCPQSLAKTAELLKGKRLEHGDCSVEIDILPGVPLIFILWAAEEDLPPSTKVLFDESAGQYLNVEDLSWMSELTIWRLTIAQITLKNKQC